PVTLDRTAIASAIITDDPYVWIRGVRAPGARAGRALAIGTWRGSAGRDFVAVRRGRDAVVLDFERAEEREGFDSFSRVIISTAHAAELVRALRIDGDSAAVYHT